MMLQALGFGKPGGGTRYYEALRTQEQGIQDPRNLPKLMKEVYSQLGDPARGGRARVNEEANIAMKEMTGLSLRTVEELQTLVASGKTSEEKQKEIEKILEKAEPLEKQSMRAMQKGFGGVVRYLAGIEADQIEIGATVAPMFMNMQKLQLKALKWLVEWLPDISGTLKDIYVTAVTLTERVFSKFGDPLSVYKEAAKKYRKSIEEVDPKYQGSLSERLDAIREIKKRTLDFGELAVAARKQMAVSSMYHFGYGTDDTKEDFLRKVRGGVSSTYKLGDEAAALQKVRAALGSSSREDYRKALQTYPRLAAHMESLRGGGGGVRLSDKQLDRILRSVRTASGQVVEGQEGTERLQKKFKASRGRLRSGRGGITVIGETGEVNGK
jgi:hypothetical protein